MISFLGRLLLNPAEKSDTELRKGYGILCGAAGIFFNVLLFAGKFFSGTLSGSIAITADAFNNLSDAGSSFVTLLSFHLAGQKPDADHPFGHGRIEYLSGLTMAMLILLMGAELAKSSLEKIRHSAPVESGILVIVILCASIAVKLYMALYNHSLGKRFHAPVLLTAATDSLCDCIATGTVLAATLAGQSFGLPLDGWVGIAVAAFILWSGFKAAKDTIDPLLGSPPTQEFVRQIRELVLSHPDIIGIHDLIVHDYGPGRVMISLHAEVSAAEDMLTIHDSIDNLERELQQTLGCHAVIHMDPIVTDDGITQETCKRVATLLRCMDDSISIHDFRMVPGPSHTNLIFDAVVPFDFRLPDHEVAEKIDAAVRALDDSYRVVVTVEHSYT